MPIKEAERLKKPSPEKRISEEDEIKVIKKYFGCHPKYLRIRGTSITIDVTGIAFDGGELKEGLLEKRSRV